VSITGTSIITLYEQAMSRVWLRLEALAQQYDVAEDLRVFAQMERTGSRPLTFSEVASVARKGNEGYSRSVQNPPLHDEQAAAIAQALEGLAMH
jgi:wyosine [tRNA(Phe)-imidazoG37] synthetase (radical SAM superfamily)